MIAQDQVLGVTDERLNIRVYDALRIHPRFNDVFGRSKQKRTGNERVNSGRILDARCSKGTVVRG